jgi:mevalonate kinase
MELICRIPGKTFILGEYAVLNSAPAMVFCHAPYFEFFIRDQIERGYVRWADFFHPDSPAGIISSQMNLNSQNLFIRCDHQYGHGGFGLSTAEFLVAYQVAQMVSKISSQSGSFADHIPVEVDHKQLLNAYWQVFDSRDKKRPSGADLQAQSYGGFCYIDQKNGILHSSPWPFDDVRVMVVPTGNKLKTHEHLNQLESIDFSPLVVLANQINNVLMQGKSSEFVRLVNEYGLALSELGLLCAPSQKMIAELRNLSGVLALKGCGAMGADSLLMVVSSQKKDLIQSELRKRDFRFFDSIGRGSAIL